MSNQASAAVLGKSPVSSTLLRYALMAAIPLALIVAGNKSAMIVGLCFIVVLGLPYLMAFAKDIGQAVRGSSHHRAAASALSEKTITPSFIGRGSACIGIAMVDEQRRKVYVNGTVADFSQIEDTEIGPFEHKLVYLDLMLRSGVEPVQRIVFDNEEAAKKFEQRLRNAMRAPAATVA
jgi:hypothetical protein